MAMPKRGTRHSVARRGKAGRWLWQRFLEGLIAKLGFSGKGGSFGTEPGRVSRQKEQPLQRHWYMNRGECGVWGVVRGDESEAAVHAALHSRG